MKYSIGFFVLPPIIFNIFFSLGIALIFVKPLSYDGYLDRESFASVLGVAFIAGIPFSIWATGELFKKIDTEVAYMAYQIQIGFVEKEEPEEEPEMVMRSEITNNGNLTQVDFFRGLTPREWREIAIRVHANRNFTFQTVGQTARPKLVPIMLSAGYIENVGNGQYNLTKRGLAFWENLAVTPFPWRGTPQKIRNLPL